jgi:toxin YhaV
LAGRGSTYESPDDAYRVFRRMLTSGHPPDDWNQLLTEARPIHRHPD